MLGKFIHTARDNRRDILRRALQSALAAPATYLVMRGLNLQEAFLAVLSAVLIIQPSAGGTMGAAFTRVQATIVGSIISLACLWLLPDMWGTPVALGMSMFVVGGVAGIRPDWTYGAVAAVGIALASESAMLETSAARGLAIAIGAATGTLVSLIVWPDRAEARFDRHFRRAVRATATRLDDALQAATEENTDAAPPDHVSLYHRAVQQAQEALQVTKLVDRDQMQRRLKALRRLYNSVIILDRAAEADAVPASGNQSMIDEVNVLRREARKMLLALADGDRSAEERTAHIDDALKRLNSTIAKDKSGTDLHQNRDVLAFGLHEVRQALSDLLELYSPSS